MLLLSELEGLVGAELMLLLESPDGAGVVAGADAVGAGVVGVVVV